MPDVFFPGCIVRIKDFQFEDGTSRDKYLLVLIRNDSAAYVISSLATSRNKFNLGATKSGCYFDVRLSTYYHFPANEIVGDGDFYFDKETYIFFRENVRKIPLAELHQYASDVDPFAIAHVGTLKSEELKKIAPMRHYFCVYSR